MANEYGGGAFCVAAGSVYFSNLADSRVYVVDPGEAPRPLTAEGPFRYGDLVFDAAHRRLLCVREDHTGLDQSAPAHEDGRIPEPKASLTAIDLTDGSVTLLAEGHDFYSTPRPSADGRRLAYIAWRHPNMPWMPPSCGWPTSMRRVRSASGRWWPAGRAKSRSSSQSGRRTGRSSSPPTAAAGGTCIAGPAQAVRPDLAA